YNKLAEDLQRALAEDQKGVPTLPRFIATDNDEVDAFALRARHYFHITLEDQAEAKDARAFYNICRKRIEDKGIIVLQDSFPPEDGSGFCLSHPEHPVIVINTKKQTRARRNFTMIHELGHLLMHKSGISGPIVRLNDTERLCNRFAGGLLAPLSYVAKRLASDVVKDPELDDVRWAARRRKISQEATVLRLEQLGLYKAGSYDKWKKLIHNANPD